MHKWLAIDYSNGVIWGVGNDLKDVVEDYTDNRTEERVEDLRILKCSDAVAAHVHALGGECLDSVSWREDQGWLRVRLSKGSGYV